MRRPSPEVCPLVAISRQPGTAVVIIDLALDPKDHHSLPLRLQTTYARERMEKSKAPHEMRGAATVFCALPKTYVTRV